MARRDELFDPIGQLRGPTTLVGRARARLRHTFRSATSELRLLPSFLIIGAARAGSTSLYSYLIEHPLVGAPSHKEIHFFDLNFEKGERWYRRHFPTTVAGGLTRARHGARLVTGEASPYYLFHPHAARNVARTLPSVRCIALLRNPIDRAYSHFQLARRNGRETLTFEEAIERERGFIDRETERIVADPAYRSLDHRHHAYVARGLYAEQLGRWYHEVDRGRMLVIRSEDLFADPHRTMTDVQRFLELPEHRLGSYEPLNRRPYEGLSGATRAELSTYYAEPNRRLEHLLGRDLGWD